MDSLARVLLIAGLAAVLSVAGCEEQGAGTGAAGEPGLAEGDGQSDVGHDDHGLASLGTVTVGDMEVQAFQGRGEAAGREELRLLVKLAGGDVGSTVRAWIGTDDRYASVIALAQYSAAHGGYELRAEAPDPLPESASWWIEVEMPDGRTHVGSVAMR